MDTPSPEAVAHHAPTLRPPRPPRALRSPRRGRGNLLRLDADAPTPWMKASLAGVTAGLHFFRGTVKVTFEFDDGVPRVWSAENAVFAGADAWRSTFDRRVEQAAPGRAGGCPPSTSRPRSASRSAAPCRSARSPPALAITGAASGWAVARRGSSTGGCRSRRARTSGSPGASSPTSPTSHGRRRPRSRSRSRQSPSSASASTRTASASTGRSAARARASRSRSSRLLSLLAHV